MSNVSNSELSNMAKTAALAATIWFLMTDNYNMVMLKSNGNDVEGAKTKFKERFVQEGSRLFYQTLLIDLFNSTFSKQYHQSLFGMSWITLTNTTIGEWLTRKSVGVPVGTHSREQLVKLEEKQDNATGFTRKYYDFMKRQLTELLTDYGPVGAIWFDGVWDQDQNPDFDWKLRGLYDHIHAIRPACLVGNNHHLVPFEGEDIQIFERDLPGENTAGLSGQEIGRLPLETCQTMNGMWGYKITDLDYKSTKTLIHYLVRAAGRNGNLLLNIGPQPDGKLPATAVERLREMGEWLARYGESIYGTRGGDIPPHDWGVTTRKGDKLYVHVLDLQDDALYLPLAEKVGEARCLNNGERVKFDTLRGKGIVLNLEHVPEDTDRIIELTLR